MSFLVCKVVCDLLAFTLCLSLYAYSLQIFSPYGHLEDVIVLRNRGWSLILPCNVLHIISVALKNEHVLEFVFDVLPVIYSAWLGVADLKNKNLEER